MDHVFSIKNLKSILDADRKKGGDLEEKYIPSAFSMRLKIYKLKKRWLYSRFLYRAGRSSLDFYERRKVRLRSLMERRRGIYESEIEQELERVAKIINGKDFRVKLCVLPYEVGGKTVYGVGKSLDQIVAVRFVQRALKVLYEIHMPPRDILVSQIKAFALDGVPKYIIRSDVESFYESIRHKDLLNEIHQAPALPVLIKRILTRLLKNYSNIVGVEKGLPRGIGVSAYLSEIYLSGIDSAIRRQDGIFYYSRYVDDMLLMYAPDRKELAAGYLGNLQKLLEKKGLNFNEKTKELNLLDAQSGKFEYLGYSFDVSASGLGISLSHKKEKKYKDRIEKAFSDYAAKSKFIPHKAASELILRCMFLTSNMRLFNNKSNAFIGVYFSNKYITNTKQLSGLDSFYQNKLKTIFDPALKRRLAKYSFKKGFEERLFRKFDSEQLAALSEGWQHV